MVESRCFLSFLRDERKEKERKEKKKKVEKRECEKNTRAQKKEEKKEIVTLFLYTRKAQNRRRIHRVVAVYPVTNGTEFRWQIFFLSTMLKNIWKNSRRYRLVERQRVRNAFETYLLLLFAQFFYAIHFISVSPTLTPVFCRGNDVPLNAAVPRERERRRSRFKRGEDTQRDLPDPANEKLSQVERKKSIHATKWSNK